VPGKFLQYTIEAAFAIAVIVAGKLWIKWTFAAADSEGSEPLPESAPQPTTEPTKE
jgi:hypothetical protein